MLQGSHPSLLPGRLISICSLLGLCFLSWHVLRIRFQADRLVATAGSLCWLALFGPLDFGTNNRVDSLSVFFGVAAVVAATSQRRWAWPAASGLLLLACFTKPTGAVAPASAIVLTLVWSRRWHEAVTIAAVTGVTAAVIFAIGDAISQGNFSTCMIFSNMNPVRFERAWVLTAAVCRQFLLPVGIGLGVGWLGDARMRPFVLHGLMAFAVATATSGKVGRTSITSLRFLGQPVCACRSQWWVSKATAMPGWPTAWLPGLIFQAVGFAWEHVGI